MRMLTALLIAIVGWASFSDQHFAAIEQNGTFYYAHKNPEVGPSVGSGQRLQPATVLTFGKRIDNVTVKDLAARLEYFGAQDDVWAPEFLQAVILQSSDLSANSLDKGVELYLERLGTISIHISAAVSSASPELFDEGPYFINDGQLHAAYRLYPDTAEAFIASTIPTVDDSRFQSLDVSVFGEQYPSSLTIAVPSRLRSFPTPNRPYAGTRIAIKDNIDLHGLKTGASSRAYTQLYGPRDSSASVVDNLLKQGFVIVSKVKLTQFADYEQPTADWVDVHAPWNPRGDGYQSPGGSSAGTAAAVASYEWLDAAIGTDTLGSIREPAALQGVFGLRPSLGAADLDGIIPYSDLFDTVCGTARSAAQLAQMTRAMYPNLKAVKCSKWPQRILTPQDFWPVEHQETQAQFEAFISQLESFLGVKQTIINLDGTWQRTAPENVTNDLSKYVGNTFVKAGHRTQIEFLDKFVEQYKQANEGRMPVLNPQPQSVLQELKPRLTDEMYAEGVQEKSTFKSWFEENVIGADHDGCSDSIMLLPWTNGQPSYRDTYHARPSFNDSGFFHYNLSPYSETPEIVVPVGQTPYHSRLSQQTEHLPVAIGILSAKGSDIMLVDLVKEFMDYLGQTDGVLVGTTSFPTVDEKQEQNDSMLVVKDSILPMGSKGQQPILDST